MVQYKEEGFSVKCQTCGKTFDRYVRGTSSSQRRERAEDSPECKVCYAKRQPKKSVRIEITVSRFPEPTIIVKALNAFEVKEALKAAGYSFDQDSKAWSKKIVAGRNIQEMLANFAPEKSWLLAQGWETAKDAVTQKLMTA